MSEVFRAEAIVIGSCGSPTCRNVHIQFTDADGKTRAQAVLGCDEIGPIVADIIATMNHVLAAHAKRELN